MQAVKTSSCNCSSANQDFIQQISEFKGLDGGLIPALHAVQERYGYLAEEALKVVAEQLEVSMAKIYGVATFYSYFSVVPKGEHIIRVCLGTACYVKGAQELIDNLSQELKIRVGETTEDGKFTLEASRCLGACGLAPAMMIDSDVYGKLTGKKIKEVLEKYNQ